MTDPSQSERRSEWPSDWLFVCRGQHEHEEAVDHSHS